MKKYDPDFDLEELTYEATEVFKEFYVNYLAGNKKYLEIVCGETVSPLLKAMIEIREKEGWRYKFEEMLDCNLAFFQGALISENKAHFTYHLEVQEFDAKISTKDGTPFESETNVDKGLISSTYRIVLAVHDEPNVEVTGHYWQIVEFYKIGEVKQLV
jgi:hypothetical protein